MLTFLEEILHGILSLPYVLDGLLVELINALILAIVALANALLSLLPGFPEPPGAPAGGIVGGILYFFPIVSIVSILTTFVTAWIVFLGVRVALRWVKAL